MLTIGSGSVAAAAPAAEPEGFLIVNKATGRCLDAFAAEGGRNGNRVGLWDCNGGDTEVWRLVTAGGGTFPYRLVNAASGRCLDYPVESDGAVGWQFWLWDCNGSRSQQFAVAIPRGG
jgi:hypothetical protein